MKNNLISILITNYNKSKFLKKSLKSLSNQKYKNFEIILFDDCSEDNSIKIIEKFQRVKLIRNKKKIHRSGPLNQINGIIEAFKRSKGKIICLMDADDFFTKNKLSIVNDYFQNNQNRKIVFNFLSTSKKIKFSIKSDKNYIIWPTIFPTSCISVRRNFFEVFIKKIKKKDYENLEIDARMTIFFKFYYNEYNLIKKKITIYNYDHFGITSKINKFSKIWWYRRSEAFHYLKYVFFIKGKKFKINLDYLLTNLIVFFFRVIKL